jgi:hypothetical protein
VRYRRRTGLVSVSCAAVVAALGWTGCESADGGEDDPPLSEHWGPTSEWPSFDPDRPKPMKPQDPTNGSAKPPATGTGADRDPGDDDEPSGESPTHGGQAPSPKPDEGPRMPPVFDAGAATPRLDAGRPSAPAGDSDAGPAPCTGDGGIATCSADGGIPHSD